MASKHRDIAIIIMACNGKNILYNYLYAGLQTVAISPPDLVNEI